MYIFDIKLIVFGKIDYRSCENTFRYLLVHRVAVSNGQNTNSWLALAEVH